MKKILSYLGLLVALIFTFWVFQTYSVNFSDASAATSKIKTVSISAKSGSTTTQINTIWYNILKTAKIAIWGLLVLYIVYAGVMMIISMWDDEKQLSNAKRSIWYAIVGLLFINIPTTLYMSFSDKRTMDDVTSSYGDVKTVYNRNIFMNSDVFGATLWSVITFLEIALVVLCVFIFILNGVKMISSWWDEKVATEAKNKILWSLSGLIFIGIMEVWRNLIFIWDLKWAWQDLFSKLANLALFFAGPVAIFFLSMAWYYYITSGWEDEKIKKAKNIVFNTVLATLLLLGMYTFLLDLTTLHF